MIDHMFMAFVTYLFVFCSFSICYYFLFENEKSLDFQIYEIEKTFSYY